MIRVALFLLAGCARTGAPEAAARPDEADRALDPIEAWLVDAAPADAPMRLVTDETEAGRALLHTPSRPVDPADPRVARLVERMRATLAREKGVGIAAPQVGVLRRVVLVQRLDREGEPVEAWLNPAITFLSEETEDGWEGCLSVPEGRGRVRRARSIRVAGDPEGGGPRVEEAVEGWTARIFQHEIDHLDGVLFTDRLLGARLVAPEAYAALRAAWKLLDGFAPEEPPATAAPDGARPAADPPFTPAALRRATRPGRRLSWQLLGPDGPVGARVLVFTDAAEDAAVVDAVEVDADGLAVAGPVRTLVPWGDLAADLAGGRLPGLPPPPGDWGVPAESAGWADTPAGAFDARVATAEDPATGATWTRWTARDLPGPPVAEELRRDGLLAWRAELVEQLPGGD